METKLRCKLCSSSFLQLSRLKIHMSYYHGQKYSEAVTQHACETLTGDSSLATKPSVEEENNKVLIENHVSRATTSGTKEKPSSKGKKFFNIDIFKPRKQLYKKTKVCCKLCSSAVLRLSRFKIYMSCYHGQKYHEALAHQFGETLTGDRCLATMPSVEKEKSRGFIEKQVSRVRTCSTKATTVSNKATTASSKERKCNTSDALKPRNLLLRETKFRCNLCSSAIRQLSGLTMGMSYQGQKYHVALTQHTGDRCLASKPSVEAIAETQIRVKNKQQYYDKKDASKEFSDHLKILNKCLKCKLHGKAYSPSQEVKTHNCIHMGDKPYLCTYCGKAFIRSRYLKEHQHIHTGDKPYLCTYCGKAFRQSQTMTIYQRIHKGAKLYLCTDCSKVFSQSQDLKTHQRIHTRDKPYLCTYCGKAFIRSRYLKTHQRIHTGDKPYLCTYCGKAFSQSQDLRRHQRIHTGDNPYLCTDCGKAFRQSQNLKAHKCIHTGDKP